MPALAGRLFIEQRRCLRFHAVHGCKAGLSPQQHAADRRGGCAGAVTGVVVWWGHPARVLGGPLPAHADEGSTDRWQTGKRGKQDWEGRAAGNPGTTCAAPPQACCSAASWARPPGLSRQFVAAPPAQQPQPARSCRRRQDVACGGGLAAARPGAAGHAAALHPLYL